MERRTFMAMLTGGLVVAPLAAEAQQAAKIARIGYLVGASLSVSPHLHEAFRQGLRDLGYVEGRNLVIEIRSAEGKLERLPALAAELVALKVDVILAGSTLAAVAAKQATRTLPIVFTSVADPVTRGFVGKELELLKEVVPKVSRVAVLGNPGNPAYGPMLREAQVAGRSLGVQLQVLEARGPNEFDRAFAAMVKQRAGALLVFADAAYIFHRTPLAQLAAKSRLPAIYGLREHVEAGGLLAYGPNLSDSFRRAAIYVDKILKGAKPADLPVEQPTKFELVINLKTAKALGLTIPPSVLERADEIIK